LKDLRRLPDEAARRLAADTGRNRTLLESIRELDDDWPVLLFCVSVEHANTMAALLTRADIPAAAISAETGKGLRRHYIDRFRRGEVRVLTNYNVLAAGFDAPRVRAVYIARPTYVPNVYQQMIGRGLRGVRNGGTERCLLVNVADNVEQFGQQLAFHEFDYLWNGAAAKAVP
jgi:superfamily II DNA or RNA helicase